MTSRNSRWSLLLIVAAVSLGACVHPAKTRFQSDTSCKKGVRSEHIGGGAMRVTGCGLVKTYVCNGAVCVSDSAVSTAPKEITAPDESTGEGPVTRRMHVDGYPIMTASTEMGSLTLRVLAAPTRDRESVTLKLEKQGKKGFPESCEIRLVADGTLIQPPAPTPKSRGASHELSTRIESAALRKLATAKRVVGDLCGERVEVTTQSLEVLREFAMRCDEEAMLAGQPAPAESSQPAPASSAL